MSAKNKRRSYQKEKELVEWAEDLGLEAHRTWGSDGRARGYAKDVDVWIDGIKIQHKRSKNDIAQYIKPHENECDILLVTDGEGYQFFVISKSFFKSVLLGKPDFPQTINQVTRSRVNKLYRPNHYSENVEVVALYEDYDEHIFPIEVHKLLTEIKERQAD